MTTFTMKLIITILHQTQSYKNQENYNYLPETLERIFLCDKQLSLLVLCVSLKVQNIPGDLDPHYKENEYDALASRPEYDEEWVEAFLLSVVLRYLFYDVSY